MPMQNKSRSVVPGSLVVLACLATGAVAQGQELPAQVLPVAAPAVPTAVPATPVPGTVAQPAPAAAPSSGAAPAPDAGPDPMTLLTGSPSCFLPPLAVDPSAISAFRAAPQDLLTPYPDGGSRMAQDVRGLAGTDVHTVPTLIDLAKNASPGQTAAIGAGLAQAARACVRQRPDVAQIIQQLIIRANLGPLTTAFVSSSGDVATAASPMPEAGSGWAPTMPSGRRFPRPAPSGAPRRTALFRNDREKTGRHRTLTRIRRNHLPAGSHRHEVS